MTASAEAPGIGRLRGQEAQEEGERSRCLLGALSVEMMERGRGDGYTVLSMSRRQ